MTAPSGPGRAQERSIRDFGPQCDPFRGPFLSNFETYQKCENQAETAARTLFSMFGKVQSQAQNQIRNREPSKMRFFEARELHEALRVTPECQRDPEKGPKVEAFGVFEDPTLCTSFQKCAQEAFRRPSGIPQMARSLKMSSILNQFHHFKQQGNHT